MENASLVKPIIRLDHTIQHYDHRIAQCNTIGDQVAQNLQKIESITTLPAMKSFLKEKKALGQYSGKISGLNKTQMRKEVEKFAETWKISDSGRRKEQYINHITFLKEIQEKGIDKKVEKALSDLNSGKVSLFKPFNYDSLPDTWGYDKKIARKVYKSLKPYENSVCFLSGGGKMASDPDNPIFVTNVVISEDFIPVQVQGYLLNDRLEHSWDFCGDFPKKNPSFDFQNMTGEWEVGGTKQTKGYGIQSWQLLCLK